MDSPFKNEVGERRKRRQPAALTIALVIVICLSTLCLYAAGDRLNPLAAAAALSHLYILALIAAVLRGRPWAIWGAGVASLFAYALFRPTAPAVAMVSGMFACVGGMTIAALSRLLLWRSNVQTRLKRLDEANADAQKHLNESSALFEIAREISRTFDMERLFEDVMRRLSNQLNMYRGQLLLYDRAAERFTLKCAYGITDADMERGRYRLGEKIYRQTLETGRPMAVPNMGDEPIALHQAEGGFEAAAEKRSVAFLCLPIVMEGETAGVLSVDRAPMDERTLRDDLNFLTIVASVFSQALKIQQMIEEAALHERLAALGEMSQSLAHEIRNPLGGIRGAAQLIEIGVKRMSGGQEPALSNKSAEGMLQYASIIIEEVERLNRVVEKQLRYGRSSPDMFQEIDLAEAAERALVLMKNEAQKSGAQIRRDFSENAPRVLADADQMTQVFLNLVSNAIDAMPDGGELRVSVRAVERMSGGSMRVVEACVQDDGPGVSPELRRRIFDPLYTTKRKGAGIGLALTKRIVEDHNGTIEVGEVGGGGCRFTVTLPAVQQA